MTATSPSRSRRTLVSTAALRFAGGLISPKTESGSSGQRRTQSACSRFAALGFRGGAEEAEASSGGFSSVEDFRQPEADARKRIEQNHRDHHDEQEGHDAREN